MNYTYTQIGFMRLPEVLALFPFSRSTLWKKVAKGEFPKPIKISNNVTAWRISDLEAHSQKLSKEAKNED